MSLKEKLNRMKGHLTKDEPKARAIYSPEVEIPFINRWVELQAKPYVDETEYVMVREVRYPLSQRHGNYTFGQLHEVMQQWGKSGIEHPLSSAQKSVEDLLFFDTETTGLHGGTGNAIFLLGYSRVEGEEVVVRQHFLASPSAEVTLYQSFLDQVSLSKDLVTYNGKSFDWPQVKTRHTLLRDSVPELPAFGHFDLLHGSRRLWKEDLESCRLANIEREKLGIYRQDDVPGYMAPILYFDFLRDKNPDTIQGVLQHNEIDVLSLITLYIHMSKLLLAHLNHEMSQDERFQIARWYEALGQDDQAFQAYRMIAESQHPLRGRAKIALGHHYKKRKEWRSALQLWEESIDHFSYVPEEIYVEVAKIYEHQIKDYEKALLYTIRAFELWKKKSNLLRRKSQSDRKTYEKRMERLEKRIALM